MGSWMSAGACQGRDRKPRAERSPQRDRIEKDVKPGRQVSTLKIFNITRDKNGTFTLAVPTMKDKDRDQLRSFGIKADGRAVVFLPRNAKVLEHNAIGKPGLLSKSCSWKIGAVDDRPVIRFTQAQ